MSDAALANFRESIAANGAAMPPATLSEVWDANWRAMGLNTSMGVNAPYNQAFDEAAAHVANTTGKSIYQHASDQGFDLQYRDWQNAVPVLRSIGAAADTYGVKAPVFDLEARARQIAADTERHAADVQDRTYGLSATATSWAASLSRQAVDPVNLLAGVAAGAVAGPAGAGEVFAGGLGFGARASLAARVVAHEAVVNAGAQAVQEPFVQAGRAGLGLEAGLGHAAIDVGMAGFAGGVIFGGGRLALAGTLRGLGRTLRAAPRGADGAPVDPTLRAAAQSLTPEDLAAAAALQERDAALAASAPPGLAGETAHFDAIDAASAAMENGHATWPALMWADAETPVAAAAEPAAAGAPEAAATLTATPPADSIAASAPDALTTPAVKDVASGPGDSASAGASAGAKAGPDVATAGRDAATAQSSPVAAKPSEAGPPQPPKPVNPPGVAPEVILAQAQLRADMAHDLPPDLFVDYVRSDGTVVSLSAKDALAATDELKTAAAELGACMEAAP